MKILITEKQLELIINSQSKKTTKVLTKEQLMNYARRKDDIFDKSKLKYGSTPFKNGKEGDAFRNYINDEWPNIAKGIDLDRSQPQLYNNVYIQFAYNYKVGDRTLGERFMENKNQNVQQYSYSWNPGTSEVPKDKTAQVKSSDSTNVVIPSKTKQDTKIDDKTNNNKIKEPEIKKTSKIYCPIIDSNSNLPGLDELLQSSIPLSRIGAFGSDTNFPITKENYNILNDRINSFAEIFINQGIPTRTACEVALNKNRTKFKDKNQIVVDSLNKLIYVFDKDGNFIARDVIISGAHKQSKDPEIIAKSYLDWYGTAEAEGFRYDPITREFIDETGKGRKYTSDFFYDSIEKRGTRFLPADIYTTSELQSDSDYYIGKDNLVDLTSLAGKPSVALHTFFVEPPRIEALKKAKELLSKPNDPKVSQEFLDAVFAGKINLSQSYGCINVTPEFLPTLRKYIPNSYVFNISEDENNYLVQNAENYFDKTLDKPNCPSPKSMGGIQPTYFS
jgi:hypothetical protein